MKNTMKIVGMLIMFVALAACGSATGSDVDTEDSDVNNEQAVTAEGCVVDADGAPIMGFPMEDTDRLEGLVGHMLPYSGEDEPPHGGIDLMIEPVEEEDPDNIETVGIVAPFNGTITYAGPQVNSNAAFPELANSYLVVVECNSKWSVALMFEMFANSDELNAMQPDLIEVEVGQTVQQGDKVGDMIVGSSRNNDGEISYRPHLDYRVIVKAEEMTIEDLLQNGDTVTIGEPESEPSFLCSYEYSDDETQDILDEVGDTPGVELGCTCPCYTGDADECGDTCILFDE